MTNVTIITGYAANQTRYGYLEDIPADPRDWNVNIANPGKLAQTLQRDRDLALLFRNLATLRTDIALFDDAESLRWNGSFRSWLDNARGD